MVSYGSTIARPPQQETFKIKFISFNGSKAEVLEEVLVADPADTVMEEVAGKYAGSCAMVPFDKGILSRAAPQCFQAALKDEDKAIISVPEGTRLEVKEPMLGTSGLKRPANDEAINDRPQKLCTASLPD
jgi:hypothetical protein